MDNLITKAAQFLQGKIRNTPLEFSQKLSSALNHPVYLKLENLQITGSFKIRGALFALSRLNALERKRGVATCSAGNHGLALAYAGKELGVPCTVFVPKSIDKAKYDKLIEVGAQVKKSDFIGYDDTHEWAANEAKKLDIPMISPFDDELIMAANGGTLAVEVLKDVPEATHFVLPMGGGGFAGGFSWHIKKVNPRAHITVCQLAACPSFQLSLQKGAPQTRMPPVDTLAGGIEGGIGAKCFEILKTRFDRIAHIQENELRDAICWFLKHHQYLIEPSSAIALAGCLYGHIQLQGPTVIVLTARNVDYATVQELLRAS